MSIAIVICLWRQARLMVAQQQSGAASSVTSLLAALFDLPSDCRFLA